ERTLTDCLSWRQSFDVAAVQPTLCGQELPSAALEDDGNHESRKSLDALYGDAGARAGVAAVCESASRGGADAPDGAGIGAERAAGHAGQRTASRDRAQRPGSGGRDFAELSRWRRRNAARIPRHRARAGTHDVP